MIQVKIALKTKTKYNFSTFDFFSQILGKGVSVNGKPAVSKTATGGSIPSTPADLALLINYLSLFI